MFSINRKLLLALQKDSNRQNHSSSGSHHSIKNLPPIEISDSPSPPLGGGGGDLPLTPYHYLENLGNSLSQAIYSVTWIPATLVMLIKCWLSNECFKASSCQKFWVTPYYKYNRNKKMYVTETETEKALSD